MARGEADDQRYIFLYIIHIILYFQFKYSFAKSEDPVGNAVMANMKGKYIKPEKPKVSTFKL